MQHAFAFFICVISSAALAQNSSAMINQALDKQVVLQITDTPLPTAMETIKQTTGVPLTTAPGVYDLLPWGEQTNISAKIQNQTLRGALDAITRKLGLNF